MNAHDEAIRLLWDAKPEEALHLLEGLAGSADALNDRAAALYALGEKEKALALLDEALTLDPDHGAAMLNSKYIRAAVPASQSRHKVLEDWGAPAGPEPTVSVIMRTYNRTDFIKEAIKSVLCQTRSDFEVVVVNDGGTRGCEEIIKRLGGGKIRYVYIEHCGAPFAFNAGLAHARGKYITYLDDDDIFYPDHIELLAGYLDKHPETSVVYAYAYRAAQKFDGKEWRVTKRDLLSFEPVDRSKLLRSNRLSVLNLMHRREIIEEIGGFNEALEVAMDWEMWIRMTARYKLERIEKVTAEYRMRPGAAQLTAKVLRQRHHDNIVIFLHRLFPLTSYMPDSPAYKKALKILGQMARRYPQMLDIIDLRYITGRPRKMYPLFHAMGKGLIGEGYREAAAASFRAAIAMSPWEPKLYFAWIQAALGANKR